MKTLILSLLATTALLAASRAKADPDPCTVSQLTVDHINNILLMNLPAHMATRNFVRFLQEDTCTSRYLPGYVMDTLAVELYWDVGPGKEASTIQDRIETWKKLR